MFDWLRTRIMSRIGGPCPVCGSKRVSIEATKRPRFIVDGARYFNYRCRACGHTWRLLARAGV